MGITGFIDLIINAVTTGVILSSRANNDGKEYGFRLAGGSHTGTTVLLVIFGIINVIIFIAAVAKSGGETNYNKGTTYNGGLEPTIDDLIEMSEPTDGEMMSNYKYGNYYRKDFLNKEYEVKIADKVNEEWDEIIEKVDK